MISMIGMWMQSTAQGYLIYSLTGSPAYLGLVGFVSGLPSWAFILYAGLVADRVRRRTLLLITQSIMMLMAFVMAWLVFTDLIQPWHILILAVILGTVNAFDMPARQSLVVDLVSREDMTNAIAFNSTVINVGAIIGPAIGGVIYALTGPGWCFTINGISYTAVLFALFLMRVNTVPAAPRGRVFDAIREGFQYVRSDNAVLTLTLSVMVFTIFGFSIMTIIPAWAVNILGGDVTTNGLLLSARGLGAVIGGITLAGLASRGYRGRLWALGSIILPISMLGFTLVRWLPLSFALLSVTGFALIIILNNSNAMVQARVPDELRGRVMALYSLMFMGGGPIGSLIVGSVADWTSEPFALAINAVALAAFAASIWFLRPDVRKLT